MTLSILICSTHTRRNTFLPKMLNSLYGQYESLPIEQQNEVEILFLVDNKKMMLGTKRTNLVDMAQGDYVVFVDDDDRVSEDYIIQLLEACKKGVDVITFKVLVTINDKDEKICHYSKDFLYDQNTDKEYLRIPNHICCVRRELAVKVPYQAIIYGEDSAYAKQLLPYLKSELIIDKILYHYDYNEKTTEAQEEIVIRKYGYKFRDSRPITLDLIILSKADTRYLYALTQQAIDAAINGAKDYRINVIVIEQQSNVGYNNATTHHEPGAFNYNKFANIGARKGFAKWIMIANNDLKFHDGWLKELLKAQYSVVSPKCPLDSRQMHINQDEKGYINGVNFSGWCFMLTRQIYEQIGRFDEDVTFWASDDATIEQLKEIDIAPMLVPTALVEHLQSTTLNTLTQQQRDDLTFGQLDKFNKKYNQNKFSDSLNFQQWKERSV